MTRFPYDEAYYHSEGLAAGLQSAKIIAPLVVSLVRPRSVVDVGCGLGMWLAAFRENGVERILGLDGEHVNPAWLVIPRDCFRAVDLNKPFDSEERYDLAICLEVLEHLPETAAVDLIRRLVALAPVVLFSAAVPFQGGVHHVNEQWPDFWIRRFKQHRYAAVDVIRKQIWKDQRIAYWYRQNMFLFIREDLVSSNAAFLEAANDADDLMLVHRAILQYQMGVRSMLKQLPRSVWLATRTRLKRIFLREP